jgi:hypothetical protein
LQVFHADAAKLDWDIANVAMVVHIICSKLLFSKFHLFFRRTLQVCLFGCCICFTYMLQVFYLDVAYILQWFSSVLVFQMHVLSVSSAFRRMLQVLHLNVSKVDWVLHLPPGFFVASPRCLLLLPALVGHPPPLPFFLMLVTFRVTRAPRGREKRSAGASVQTPHSYECPGTSKPLFCLTEDLPISIDFNGNTALKSISDRRWE